MTEVKHDLAQLADLALRMARSRLSKTQDTGLIVVIGNDDGTTTQLPVNSAVAAMLNDGDAKDILFGAIRAFVGLTGATAVVMSTECWRAKSTEAALALPPEEFRRMAGEKGFETLRKLGFVERTEAIVATAQDKDNCHIVTQDFRRDARGAVYSFGDVEAHTVPQDGFEGRQKMFGDLSAEKIR